MPDWHNEMPYSQTISDLITHRARLAAAIETARGAGPEYTRYLEHQLTHNGIALRAALTPMGWTGPEYCQCGDPKGTWPCRCAPAGTLYTDEIVMDGDAR